MEVELQSIFFTIREINCGIWAPKSTLKSYLKLKKRRKKNQKLK
jgi:hypothetical protein